MKYALVAVLMGTMLAVSWTARADELSQNEIKQAIKAQRKDVKEDWPKKEEPALRPYKAFGIGLYTLVWHTVKALADGNEKFPGIGSVEVFRGIRKGTVELVTRTYTGMAGTKPKDHTYYSKPNQVIDSSPFLYHATDFLTPGIIATAATDVEGGLAFAVPVNAAQHVTDHRPFAKKTNEKKEGALAPGRVTKAQQRYIGKRASINRNTDLTGNLLKLARRK